VVQEAGEDSVAAPVEEVEVEVAVGGDRGDTVEWIREENIPTNPD
jgi:hypothetical protein